ncbi:MAG TPA: SpaA isopeptide-forming pilin-related protein [Kofleriaceae bacterium]|nr:SpaA isopeptide-forming pilin-related protein [Kofleriaceae bacterium]
MIESAASLPDSNFEIDDDANLKVDVAGHIDWATVTEARVQDKPTGAADDSFAGGAKEDDPCPGITDGSIPNNKSDLRWFGVYEERGAGGAGFLNLFWTRVQDPTGTTLMDFELNQSATSCGNGVNPTRTAGDLLIEYRLEQGGATATIKVREWTGSVWGDAQDLSAINAATGTINSSPIPASEADGLGALSARTFGEAQIDLDFIFDKDKCTSFGSAFVKSRSSDSFTSQLKDFIAPTPISLSNCGKVTIRKETDPDGQAGSFTFTHNLATDPAQTSTTFQLSDGQSKTFTNVLLGTGYTVGETTLASGFDLSAIDCSASSGVTPTISVANKNVTFDLDNTADTVDCTFTNRARGTIVIEKITTDGVGTFGFTSASLGGFNLTTTALGTAGKASKTFVDLVPGTYGVAETEPAGWNLASATCSDGSAPGAISLAAGETVTCTFTNVRERGALKITKLRKHAADGPGPHPQAGVTFTVSGGGLGAPVLAVTGSDGTACVPNLLYGNYLVTEIVPTGYVPDGLGSSTVTVDTEGTCAAGYASATFGNTPLTNLSIAVDSIVPGGTASTISCTPSGQASTGADGDGTLALQNLVPGTYTCTIVIDP